MIDLIVTIAAVSMVAAAGSYKRPRPRPITGITRVTVHTDGGDHITHEQDVYVHPVTGRQRQLGRCVYCGGDWPCATVRTYAGPEQP